MAFLIPLEAGGSSWFTVNAPRWRRDAEAERHRVSGTCKFSDFLRTPTRAFLYFYENLNFSRVKYFQWTLSAV